MKVEEEAMRAHVAGCAQCSSPDDGCEEGQGLECELLEAGGDTHAPELLAAIRETVRCPACGGGWVFAGELCAGC